MTGRSFVTFWMLIIISGSFARASDLPDPLNPTTHVWLQAMAVGFGISAFVYLLFLGADWLNSPYHDTPSLDCAPPTTLEDQDQLGEQQ